MVNRIIQTGQMISLVASATGDTVVLATQTTSGFIVVNAFSMLANTTTTNQITAFQVSGSTGSHFRSALDTSLDGINMVLGDGDKGWRLSKNTGLDVNLATAGAISVDVLYSVVDDI